MITAFLYYNFLGGNVMTIKKERETFLQQYKAGKSITEIAQTYNQNWSSVYRILNNKNIEIKEERDICSYYLNGDSTVKISKKYGVNNHLISRILEKYNIKRTHNGVRKYSLNETYFDEIDTPTKAYILGFFYADGSNCKSKRTIAMSLQESDKDILERIRNEVGSEKPLEFIDYSNKHDFSYTYKNQYRLLFFSGHMCNALEEKGMIPNKSLSLTFPTWLDKNLWRHFIRGYFDGDGSVHFAKNGNCIVTLTSTNSFCDSIKKFIKEELNIHGCITDSACHNGITKVLSISGKNQVKTFLDFLYKDADIFLERKYQLYQNKYYNLSQAA